MHDFFALTNDIAIREHYYPSERVISINPRIIINRSDAYDCATVALFSFFSRCARIKPFSSLANQLSESE